MSDSFDDPRSELTRAARQLLAIEDFLGGPFVPARADSLPQIEMAGPSGAAAVGAGMSRDEKVAALAAIDDGEVKACTKCGLCKGRTNTVFGEGDADSSLVFVGEAPGADEDASGRPFVGRAGELLAKMIKAMGFSREQVFICNMVKCRPPSNRAPAPEETQACWDYLIRQLQIISPKVIVTLGNPATQGLLNTKTGITKLRGNFQELPDIGEGLAGTAVMPTFHPAYVLRQYTPENRGKVWSDLQQVMGALGMELPSA
jgi:uracil-DNA glycosylase